MCGYDPFWIYDYLLEQQYLERSGMNEDTELQRGDDDKAALCDKGDAD